MKKITLLIALLILVCLTMQAQKKPKQKVLTVTYVHREENKNEVWARSGKAWYKSNCISDSLKIGSVIKALPYKGQKNCDCVFKRAK